MNTRAGRVREAAMRLGGPVGDGGGDARRWAELVRGKGYSAAYCPLADSASDAAVTAYARAAADAGIVIAEVGAWSNPLAPDADVRKAAIDLCKRRLDLAERIGARCCVNIAGSCGEQWDGPHADNLTPETFDRIVETTREIIDAVRPTRTRYALEPMPWSYPDSPESYVRLIEAIDRSGFAAHLDPVNMITSPALYYSTGDFLRRCFALLGPYIVSCHAKDILLSGKLTVHLEEAAPGCGGLDYAVFLREMERLDPNTPLMLEHLANDDEYTAAAEYIRGVAWAENIALL
jgi:sugar phosphate isomerase/epimerase